MPVNNRQFDLALEALDGIVQEESASLLTPPEPAAPTLESLLAEIRPLPLEALFLGMADDGLLVLLNLHDPVPGPILVASDEVATARGFLKFIARTLVRTHPSTELQYGVITDRPEEWMDVGETSHRVGVFPTFHNSADDFILSLAAWAHGNRNPRHSVLLLIDDLESAAKLDFDTLQNLRWLLLRGPSRRVWPIVAADAARYGQVLSWIPNFRTRILGRIGNERVARALGGDDASALEGLREADQFSLRENGSWLKFWLPGC